MANLYWDADGDSSVSVGGTGTWDTSAANWRTITGNEPWTSTGITIGRTNHSTVQLGDGRVLLTGGYNSVDYTTAGATYLTNCKIYDPATNIWSSVASMTTGRSDHTSILLNNGKILVIGGRNGTTYLTSCELYDPTTNTWSAAASLLTGRYYHTATLLSNGKVLVTGGRNGTTYLNYCELYDPTANTWTSVASMLNSRLEHTATLLGNGKVLVTGGSNSSATGAYLSSCELYDPTANTWTTVASMVSARYRHTTTLLSSGKVLVTGGYYATSGSPSYTTFISTCELYDPSTNTWSSAGSLTTGRYYHTSTILNNGKVLVAGGKNGSTYLNSCELYDPTANTWTTVASILNSRQNHTTIKLNSGNVLIVAGFNGVSYLSSFEIYDPSANTWEIKTSLISPRLYHRALLLNDGRVLVIGGNNGSGPLSTCELYDPSTNTWSAAASLTTGRDYHAATLLDNGKVLVTGGRNGTTYLNSCELYDPTANTWSTVASMASARYVHSACLLSDSKVLVIGGTNTSSTGNPILSCEIYDPETNTWSAAANMATARSYPGAILLDNGKVLVAGGYAGAYLSSCELYDPSTNTWTTVASMSTTRSIPTSTRLDNGKILVTGSYAAVEIFDPSTNTWSSGGSFTLARGVATAVKLNDGRVLTVGGGTTACEIYDPYSNTWVAGTPLAVVRTSHTITPLYNGKILAVGGYTGNTSTNATDSWEIYNFANLATTWDTTGSNIAYFSNYSNNAGIVDLGANVLISGIYSNMDGYVINTSGSNVITLTAASTANITTGTFTLNAPVAGSFNFIKAGAGALNVTSSSTYTGATILTGGNLSISSIKSLSVASSLGAPTTLANGTIALGAATAQVNLQYTGTGDTTDRVINLANTTGNVVITQAGTGLLKFTSNLTATGAGSKNLVLGGSTSGTGEISGVIVNNSTTNRTAIVKNDIGTWTLSGNNTFTGPVTINGGNLIVTLLSAGGTVGSLGASVSNAANLVINGGYLNYNSAVAANLTRSLTIGTSGGGFAATGSAPMHINSTLTLAGTNTARTVNFITNSSTMHFSSVLGDNGTGKTSVNILGDTGTLNIQGATTFSGNITINSGGLSVDTLGQLGGGNYTGTISLGGYNLSLNSSVDQIISGNITGIGAVTKTSTNKLTLTGVNTHSSGTSISNGNLVIGSSSALGTGTLTVTGGGLDTTSLDVSITNSLILGSNLSFWGTGNLTQTSGDITLTNSNTTFNVSNRTLQLGGNISGNSNLIKIGSGKLSLAGSNTFSNVSILGGYLVLEDTSSDSQLSSILLNGGSLYAYRNVTNISVLSGSIRGNATVSSDLTIPDLKSNTLAGSNGDLKLGNVSLLGQATITASDTSKVFVSNLTSTLSNISSRFITLNFGGLTRKNGYNEGIYYNNSTVELTAFNLGVVMLDSNQVALLQQGNNSVGVFVASLPNVALL